MRAFRPPVILMRTVITGASGQLGTAVALELRRHGFEVLARFVHPA